LSIWNHGGLARYQALMQARGEKMVVSMRRSSSSTEPLSRTSGVHSSPLKPAERIART
jgi:hypothetical protein